MRPSKEQIDKMAQAMCGLCTEDKRCIIKYSAPCIEVASQDCSYKESAEELICKGYGDIKQAKINVLNKVMTYINNKIENDYGDMSDSVEYITINIDEFDDFIDELIKEVQK